MTLRIANGAGFLGDWLGAPRQLVTGENLDYLTLEYLAELTMSILARQREKDPQAGFANDLLLVLEDIAAEIARQPQLKIVTNGGGMNPPACAKAAAKILVAAGLKSFPIGVVTGDDLLPRLQELTAAGCEFRHFETNEPLPIALGEVVAANAYLGARPIAEALEQGSRLVITGRVADASLTVGPAMHEFGWDCNDLSKLATATAAGHLLECGAQATGGYASTWKGVEFANIGYPIAEMSAAGELIVTKPPNTGGVVDRRTITEQLLYEIGDPKSYKTPDLDLDFTGITVEEVGPDRVRVSGASGRPPSEFYKVSLAYRDGYFASGELLVSGEDCVPKARACTDIIRQRTEMAGFDLARFNVELLGAGEAAPSSTTGTPPEVMLRVTAHDPNRAALERFTREFAPLITSGPAGLAGYAAGRPQVRPVFAYWPTLIEKSHVPAKVQVATAEQWL